jgi:hypothetical protein
MDQGDASMRTVERRTTDRSHNEQWPEAMRDEFRKVQFLHAVEVDEVDGEPWCDIFESFEGRHIRFL